MRSFINRASGAVMLLSMVGIGEDRMQRRYWIPMSRSFWLGIGSGMATAAVLSLVNTFVAISRGCMLPPELGTAFKIIGGVTFVFGIVVGMLGARFARPVTVASSQRAGYTKMAQKLGEEVLAVMLEAIGGFVLALVVLHSLLTFAFNVTHPLRY